MLPDATARPASLAGALTVIALWAAGAALLAWIFWVG
jgi:hypothetical protein